MLREAEKPVESEVFVMMILLRKLGINVCKCLKSIFFFISKKISGTLCALDSSISSQSYLIPMKKHVMTGVIDSYEQHSGS